MHQPIIDRDQFTESAALSVETITYVHHWTDGLFTLKMTRPAELPLPLGRVRDDRPAQATDGKPLLRAYSVASPS